MRTARDKTLNLAPLTKLGYPRTFEVIVSEWTIPI